MMNLKPSLWASVLLATMPVFAETSATEEICSHLGKSRVHVATGLSGTSSEVVAVGNSTLLTACKNALKNLGLALSLPPAFAPFNTGSPLTIPLSADAHKGTFASSFVRKITFIPRPPPANLHPQKINDQEGVYYIPESGNVSAEVEAVVELVTPATKDHPERRAVPPVVEKREGQDGKGKKYDFLFRIYSSYSWTYGAIDQVDANGGTVPIQFFVKEIMDTPQVRATLRESRVLVVVGTASQETKQPSVEYSRARDRAFVLQRELRPLIDDPTRKTTPPTYMLNLGRYRGTGGTVAAMEGGDGKYTMSQRPVVLVSLIDSEAEDFTDGDLREALLSALEGHLLAPENYEGNPDKQGEIELMPIESDVPVRAPASSGKKRTLIDPALPSRPSKNSAKK